MFNCFCESKYGTSVSSEGASYIICGRYTGLKHISIGTYASTVHLFVYGILCIVKSLIIVR